MKFNAEKFTSNADRICRKAVPKSHRQILDGKEVVNGKIEYEVDEEEFYLYPVLPEWCSC